MSSVEICRSCGASSPVVQDGVCGGCIPNPVEAIQGHYKRQATSEVWAEVDKLRTLLDVSRAANVELSKNAAVTQVQIKKARALLSKGKPEEAQDVLSYILTWGFV